MRFDPGTTSFMAALFSTPAVSRLISVKDRHRRKGIGGRVQWLESSKWLRRIEALQKPMATWTESENSTTNEPVASSLQRCGIPPIVGGILLSGITAVLMHLTGAWGVIKQFSAAHQPNEVETVAKARGPTKVGEEVNATLKDFEADLGNFVETVSPTDGTLTKEEITKQQMLIREVADLVSTSYYNERDRDFSKEKWTKIRDEALRKKPKTKESAYRIIRGMLAKGLNDQFAQLIAADDFQTMRKYDMTGVGLNIGSADEFYQKVTSKTPGEKRLSEDGIVVMGLLKGSESERAGIQQGDRILEVDGKSVDGSNAYAVSQMIKDKSVASTVTLKLSGKEGNLREVEVVREFRRPTPAVKTTMDRVRFRRVGRIAVTGCNSEARQAILEGLTDLESRGIKDVILDLRGNPGGLVEEAAQIAKLFLAEGETVYIKRDGGDRNETRFVADRMPQTKMRVTVQVDDHTASAAEIIAGALQDNCRGVISGNRTYGKGLIQSVFQLSDGSGLKLTVGKYYTPLMRDIDRSGIVPDFNNLPPADKADATIKACRLRRTNGTK